MLYPGSRDFILVFLNRIWAAKASRGVLLWLSSVLEERKKKTSGTRVDITDQADCVCTNKTEWVSPNIKKKYINYITNDTEGLTDLGILAMEAFVSEEIYFGQPLLLENPRKWFEKFSTNIHMQCMESGFLEPPGETKIGSRNRAIEISGVKLQWNKSKGNNFWFELSGFLRNRGSTVVVN